MLPDNIPFPWCQLILPARIFQRNIRMVKAVQLFVGILVMPVIEEVVVEQRAPNQVPFVTVDAKFFKKFFQLQAAFRYADRMAVYGHASVLDKVIGAFKIAGLQNVPTMLSQIPAQLCMLPRPFPESFFALLLFALVLRHIPAFLCRYTNLCRSFVGTCSFS